MANLQLNHMAGGSFTKYVFSLPLGYMRVGLMRFITARMVASSVAPIISLLQAVVLGMHAIKDKHVVVNG